MQSRLSSLTESLLNTASGFVISLLVSRYLYPLYGFKPTWGQMSSMTMIFTVVSIARSYVWRRFFNNKSLKTITPESVSV